MTNEEIEKAFADIRLKAQLQTINHIRLVARYEALRSVVKGMLTDESLKRTFDKECEDSYKVVMQVTSEGIQDTNPALAAKLIDGIDLYGGLV